MFQSSRLTFKDDSFVFCISFHEILQTETVLIEHFIIHVMHNMQIQLLARPTAFKNAILLMDSKSAIQTAASNKQATTQTVKEARRTIKFLNKQRKPFSGSTHTQEYTAMKQPTYWQQKRNQNSKQTKHNLTLKQLRDL